MDLKIFKFLAEHLERYSKTIKNSNANTYLMIDKINKDIARVNTTNNCRNYHI